MRVFHLHHHRPMGRFIDLQDEKAFSLSARLTKRFHELWFVVSNRPRGDFGIRFTFEHRLWYYAVAHLALVPGRAMVHVYLHLR